MIKVLSAGIFSSVQDLGRNGFASVGVPVSGVMDEYAAKLANRILQNTDGDAVIEVTFGFCKFQFLSATYICVSGADLHAQLNGVPIVLNTAVKVNTQDILSFQGAQFGVRAYVAVVGGILSESVLGSRSQYQNITTDFRLKKDDCLKIVECTIKFSETNAVLKSNINHFKSEIIECYPGPEFDLLSLKQKLELRARTYTLSNNNSRMGCQFNEVLVNDLKSILTSSVLVGTVQLTPSGTLIALMRDCQVTGGYPRILQLTDQSINRLAQKMTNDSIKFKIES